MSTIADRLASSLATRYRIDRELGAGGMATVYLALDLKHEREVAIKVLHPDLGAALGGQRFLAEIKTTAKLQHPHILPLLDSGEADGLLYYVMPFVRGETLRARLERERQLPIADAVRIAREVASALDHAHRQGIVHRDIKPENILLQDGAALVADFGIALAVQTAADARMTRTGLSLGTPQYMSPEQAMGERTVDARSDVYALGVVAYEMLAGEPPFTGPTLQAIVARVIAEAPRPLITQRKAVPPEVEAAILRALDVLPADRFPSAAEFADALAGGGTAVRAATHTSRTQPARRSARGLLVVAGGAAMVAGVAGWFAGQRMSEPPAAAGRLAVEVRMGDGTPRRGLAISRDARRVAMIVTDSSGVRVVRVRDLTIDSVQTIAGTGGASSVSFSPDGQALVFVGANSTMRRIPRAGGPSTQLAQGVIGSAIDWADDGWVYFTRLGGGLSRVPAEGGAEDTLTHADSARREFAHWDPQLLPDGKTLLFFSYAIPADSSRVELFDLTTRTRTRLLANAINPRYLGDGLMTVMRGGVVHAVRLDLAKRRVLGTPTPLLTGVSWEQSWGTAGYVVSRTGVLAMLRLRDIVTPRVVREIARDGRDVATLTTPGLWAEPRLSPDGRTVAMTANAATWQIWLHDRVRRVTSQLTRGSGASFSPNWTPDGRSLVHLAETPVFDIVRTAVDGSRVDTLLTDKIDKLPTGIGPDGRTLAFLRLGTIDELFVLGADGEVRPIGTETHVRGGGLISPDGRWIVYDERAPDRPAEVFVQSMNGTARRQVSADGGDQPRWSRGGRELVFRRGDALFAASFDPVSGEVGVPVELFRRPAMGQVNRASGFDVSADGERFFLVVPAGEFARPTIGLVFDWRREVARALGR